jgi:hypothetical protein
MARKKKSVVESILGDVKDAINGSPSEAIKSHKSGAVKSKYEDHAKFSKFKIKGDK